MKDNQKKGIALIFGGTLTCTVFAFLIMRIFPLGTIFLFIIGLIVTGFGIKLVIPKDNLSQKGESNELHNKTPYLENSTQTNKMVNIKLGVFIAVIGIAAIIISQTTNFTKKEFHPSVNFYGVVLGSDHYSDEPNPELKNGVLYSGISLLIIGAGIATLGSVNKNK